DCLKSPRNRSATDHRKAAIWLKLVDDIKSIPCPEKEGDIQCEVNALLYQTIVVVIKNMIIFNAL
ncbi:hypothetical protein O5585_28170, partial [Escherichia coli]|nr:hypothetical protein [Escherichia coli]